MISKKEATKRAMKMLPPTGKVQVMRIEVALAYMELHGLEPARTRLGNPLWDGGVLVLKPTPPPAPPHRKSGDGEGSK